MALQSKFTVYLAIVGVFALMGGIVFYASLDNDELALIEIELTNVELLDVNTINNQAKFEVTFLVTNPSDKTLTVSQIDFQLYGDEKLLGPGLYSTADIALPGRALFFSGAEIPLKNTFVLASLKLIQKSMKMPLMKELLVFLLKEILSLRLRGVKLRKISKQVIN